MAANKAKYRDPSRFTRKGMQFLPWLLCFLGLHQPLVTCPGEIRDGMGRTSAFGSCGRCNTSFQWDH